MELEKMMLVDGVPVAIEGERNLLEVISKTGVKLRRLPYVYGGG